MNLYLVKGINHGFGILDVGPICVEGFAKQQVPYWLGQAMDNGAQGAQCHENPIQTICIAQKLMKWQSLLPHCCITISLILLLLLHVHCCKQRVCQCCFSGGSMAFLYNFIKPMCPKEYAWAMENMHDKEPVGCFSLFVLACCYT